MSPGQATPEPRAPSPDQEPPDSVATAAVDPSTRRHLPARMLVTGVGTAIVAGVVAAIVGYAVAGQGLAIGLGLAFALGIGVLSAFIPAMREDGKVNSDSDAGRPGGLG